MSEREEEARNKLAQLQDAKIAADQEVSSRRRSSAGHEEISIGKIRFNPTRPSQNIIPQQWEY